MRGDGVKGGVVHEVGCCGEQDMVRGGVRKS